jgi:hypothetical protein
MMVHYSTYGNDIQNMKATDWRIVYSPIEYLSLALNEDRNTDLHSVLKNGALNGSYSQSGITFSGIKC